MKEQPPAETASAFKRALNRFWAIVFFDNRSYLECIAVAVGCMLIAAIMKALGTSDWLLLIPFVPGIAAACAAQSIRQLGLRH